MIHEAKRAMPGNTACAFLSAVRLRPGPQEETAQGRQEIAVVTSGGFAAAYALLAPQFERERGVSLVTSHGASTGGARDSIPERLARSEKFDLVILSRSSLDELTARGFIDVASRTDLAHSKIGMAVRADSALPDISTPERFIALLHSAESIGYSASASGTYLSTELFPRLGIWDEIRPKSTRVIGERVAAVVARGEVEIGFQQISEILPIEGAAYVGPIPDEFQKVTTFSAGIPINSARATLARDLMEYLASPAAAATIRQTGLEPVNTAEDR
jgi:molybdate transport system substrate-binding protein